MFHEYDDDFPELNTSGVMNTNFNLCKLGDSPDTAVNMCIELNKENIQGLLRHCSERLGVSDIEKVVNIDGEVIDDVLLIQPHETLFAVIESEGEDASQEHTSKSKIGSFAIGKFLGAGSFGKVHVGVHQMTQEKVALKFMDKSKLGSFEDGERIFTEVQCLNSLDHPNVIKLLQVIDTPDNMVLAMEYATGGDLKVVLEKYKALEEPIASRLFLQILDGVNYCHRHNVVHYDLKLENILLMSELDDTAPREEKLLNLQVKIADFGLSQLTNPGKTSHYNAGSLAYIAPEVFQHGETAAAPRDIWALGVILFTMVNGRLPFSGSTYEEISKNIRKAVYSVDDKVSESCSHILSVMLQANPLDRMGVNEIRLHSFIEHSKSLPHQRSRTPNMRSTRTPERSSRTSRLSCTKVDSNCVPSPPDAGEASPKSPNKNRKLSSESAIPPVQKSDTSGEKVETVTVDKVTVVSDKRTGRGSGFLPPIQQPPEKAMREIKSPMSPKSEIIVLQ